MWIIAQAHVWRKLSTQRRKDAGAIFFLSELFKKPLPLLLSHQQMSSLVHPFGSDIINNFVDTAMCEE
jgi:hypothetical protein